MQIIQHRINEIQQLSHVHKNYGVELDVRDKYNEVIIAHDAFNNGENWTDYLKHFHHSFMIVNIKTEGIEKQIVDDLASHQIDNYFLLDVSLPFLVKLSNQGFRKMAVRFSDYEPIEFTLKFAGKVNWVWVDCFNGCPLNQSNYEILKKYFKICLVSPELHGKPIEEIIDFQKKISDMQIDAVCTKYPNHWLPNNI